MFPRGSIALERFIVLKRLSRFQHTEPCGFYIVRRSHHRNALFFRLGWRKSPLAEGRAAIIALFKAESNQHGPINMALRPACPRSASGSSTRLCQAFGCVAYGAERLRNSSPAMYPALDIGPRTHATRAGMVRHEPFWGNIRIISPGDSCTRVRIPTPWGDRFIVKALCFAWWSSEAIAKRTWSASGTRRDRRVSTKGPDFIRNLSVASFITLMHRG